MDFPDRDVDARYRGRDGRGGVKGVRGLTGERGNIRLEVGKRLGVCIHHLKGPVRDSQTGLRAVYLQGIMLLVLSYSSRDA